MAPTLVIAGYYGFGNWGDEAALAVLVRHLRRALPTARLIVLSHDPPQTARLHETEAINRWNFFEVRRALSCASGFILGPGSLLQDATSTRSLLYYLGLVWWAQRYELPTYLIGQGIGPLRSQRSEQWVAQTLHQAQLVLVRDQASYRWASAHSAHVLLGEDMALLYDLSPAPSPPKSRVVALSLRPGLAPTNLKALRRLVQTLAAEEFEIVFLPFQAVCDLAVLRELALPIPIVPAHRPDDLLEAMHSVDVVLGMRLHSLVFAVMSEVPFCAISYDPKVESFLQRVGAVCDYPLRWWDASETLNESTLVQEILELYARRVELQKSLQQGRALLQAAAQQALDEAIRMIVRDLGQ